MRLRRVDRVMHGKAPLRVLLVEADSRIADLVAGDLRLDGAEVVVAEDPEVGRFLACTEIFNVVLVDPGPPGPAGLRLLRAVHAGNPTVPVIAITGWDDPEGRQACVSAGASQIITRPFSLDELRGAVTAAAHSTPNSTVGSAGAQLELT